MKTAELEAKVKTLSETVAKLEGKLRLLLIIIQAMN
jgi:hypothetical protein